MTSFVPPKKNDANGFIFYTSLAPRTANGTWQSNPTLAAGDVKISIDGGSLSNLGTLPAVTPASSKLVKVTLSQSEINGDNITIIFSDAAGAEWCDRTINFQTSTRQIDDLAFPTVSGRSIDVSTGGEVGLDWANIGSPTTTVGLSGTTVKTATDVETDTQDIQSRIPTALGANGNIKADVRDFSGTAGTFASGRPEVNTSHIAGSAVSTSSAQIGVNVVNWKGSAAPAMTGDAYARLGAPVGLSVSADIATVAGYVDTEVAAIKAKTDNLPADPADASDIAAAFSSLQTHGDSTWATATGFSTLDAAGVRAAVGLASANLDTQLDAIPTAAEINAEVDTALADYDGPTRTEAAADKDEILAILGTPAGADIAADIADLPTNAELATALAGADDAVLAAIAALNNVSVADVLTTQMTESYAANGSAPTLAQALFAIHQYLMQFAIAGTAYSVKKLDNSTEAFSVTLDDATSPTGAART